VDRSAGPAECHQPDALAQKQGPNGSGFLRPASKWSPKRG
jgi:hypothetical protein